MTGSFGDNAVDIEYDAWEAAAESGDWRAAAEQARSQMASSEPVVVAVVDTGVDASNPDLAPVMWDDGLSIPELVELGGDEHGLSTYADPNATSTSGIEPTDAHGTHVAGIIAAAWDGAGTSGIAPNAEIMSVRLDFSTANAIEAFNYIAVAADAGVNVRVANCSWTVGATASRSLDLAIRQMGERGVVSLFASGNNNSDMDRALDMASLLRENPYVLAVNSIDPAGDKSYFSCYGAASTDVMAPGGTILSTYHTAKPSYMGEVDDDAVLYESFDAGTATIAGLLPTWRANAHAAYRDGVFLVSGGQNDGAQGGSAAGVDCVTPLAHDEERPSDYPGVIVPYPAGWLEGATVDTTQVVTETGKTAYAVVACGGGFMLVGPRSDSGRTDTYTLEAEAGAAPRATGLNASHLALLNPAATVHDGMLYVLAATTSEPYRVFAATPVDDLWEQGGEDEPDEPEDPSEGEAEDGKPGDTGDAAGPGNSEDPGKPGSSDGHLAQTGDASMTYVIVLGALGCISLAAGRALRALRAARSGK